MLKVQESRQRKRLYAPVRSAVPVPGQPGRSGDLPGRIRENWSGGCFLIPFCTVGIGIFLFGLAGTVGPWRDGLREGGDPRFFYTAMAFGAVFFLVALRMLQIVFTAPALPAKRTSTKTKRSSPPWTADHPWRPEGMDPDYSAGTGGYALGRIAFLALIALFNLAMRDAPWLFKIIIALFDLFGLVILYDSLQKLWQGLRYSRPRIVWQTFPAFTGSRLEAVFRPARPLRPSGPIRATLRCLQDEWTSRQTQNGQTSELEAFITYEQTAEVPAQGEMIESVRLIFDVPPDLPGTDLSTEEASYWQVLVQVPVAGPDFEAVFLAPVYRKEGMRK